MNIEFIDDNTVKITASIPWIPVRPPPGKKQTQKKEEFLAKFRKKHPSYVIDSVEGPSKISNFREKEDSIGTWTLKVSKKKKNLAESKATPTPTPPAVNRKKAAKPRTKKQGA